MKHTISHYEYLLEIWYGDKCYTDEPQETYTSHSLFRIKNRIDSIYNPEFEQDYTVCLSMTEVYCCGYEVLVDKAAWSDKNDFTNIYNFIKEQEIRDTWIETHLKGVEND